MICQIKIIIGGGGGSGRALYSSEMHLGKGQVCSLRPGAWLHLPPPLNKQNLFKKMIYELPAKMEAFVDILCLLAQPKDGQQQFKNKKQPELTENRNVWESNDQRDKEETFIQTGRRGGEVSWQGSDWRTQRGGRLWNGAGQAVAGRPCGPTFMQIGREGRTQSGGERGRQSSG